MFGLIIGLLIVAYKTFVGGQPVEVGFLSATEFLWIWAAVTGVICGIGLLAASAGGAASGGSRGGLIGGLLGFAGGTALGVLAVGIILVRQACLLGGTYLLMTAGTAGQRFDQFSDKNLIYGGILLLIGIMMGLGRSSSSSNSKKKD